MAFCKCNRGKSLSNFTVQFSFFLSESISKLHWGLGETKLGLDRAGFRLSQVANCQSAWPKAECHKYLPSGFLEFHYGRKLQTGPSGGVTSKLCAPYGAERTKLNSDGTDYNYAEKAVLHNWVTTAILVTGMAVVTESFNYLQILITHAGCRACSHAHALTPTQVQTHTIWLV
jgi:hypothetical protein